MEWKRSGIHMLLVCTAVFILSACGKKQDFDASGYVKSALDAMYKEEYKEHAKYIGENEKKLQEEMEQDARSGIEQALAGKELTQEDKDNYAEFYRRSYKLAKYTVGDAKTDEDNNYEVEVTVVPCTLWKDYYAGIEDELREFSSGKDTFTDSEYFNAQLAYMNECLESPSYDSEKKITIHVTANANRVYSIPDKDMSALENAMFPIE